MPWGYAAAAAGSYLATSMQGGKATGYAMNPQIGQYADKTANTGQDALTWLKQNYADTQGLRDNTINTALQTSSGQQQIAGQQADLSASSAGVLTGKINPLISNLADTATGYDTTARRESAAAQANADVDSQLTAERQAQARAAMARGVDPTSGNFIAGDSQLGATGAAAKAAAMNAARLQVENTGINLKTGVAGLGINLGNLQNSQTASALAGGNSAVETSNVPNQVNASGAGLMLTGFNTAMTGAQNAGNILNGQAATATKAATEQDKMNNDNLSSLGSAIGKAYAES